MGICRDPLISRFLAACSPLIRFMVFLMVVRSISSIVLGVMGNPTGCVHTPDCFPKCPDGGVLDAANERVVDVCTPLF